MATEPTSKTGHHAASSSHSKVLQHGRSEAICNDIQQYAICIAEAVKDIYVDSIQDNQTGVFFSVSTAELPKRKYVSSRSYAGNPWFKGRPVVPPKTDIADLLEAYLPSLPDNQLARKWIVHGTPREITIRAVEIQLQLIGNGMLDHELGSILICRQMQMDAEANFDTPSLTHRHILECDFSTLALADNTSISRFIEIQNQFILPVVQHALEACQLFYFPAILREGWALYMWDMIARVIHIIAPSVGEGGWDAELKERHELIASRLHDALFQCLQDFFAVWPTPKENWTTKFPKLFDTAFTREETGYCVMHTIRYHDGEKLRVPINRNALKTTKLCALQDAMKLQGNQSSLPADAIWSVFAPSGEFDDNTSQ